MKKNMIVFAGAVMILLASCAPTQVCPTYLKNTKNVVQTKRV